MALPPPYRKGAVGYFAWAKRPANPKSSRYRRGHNLALHGMFSVGNAAASVPTAKRNTLDEIERFLGHRTPKIVSERRGRRSLQSAPCTPTTGHCEPVRTLAWQSPGGSCAKKFPHPSFPIFPCGQIGKSTFSQEKAYADGQWPPLHMVSKKI